MFYRNWIQLAFNCALCLVPLSLHISSFTFVLMYNCYIFSIFLYIFVIFLSIFLSCLQGSIMVRFLQTVNITVVVPKCFIKHMCFIVLYFHGHAFFSLEIAKKCFFVLYFLKNVLYFCKLFKWVEYLFQVFIYNTKIGEL